jgi:hypothetical protein
MWAARRSSGALRGTPQAACRALNHPGLQADPSPMRLRLLALLLVALMSSGCFALDELDKSNEILDSHSPTRGKNAKAAQAAGQAGAKPGDPAQDPKAREKAWWSSARSLSTADEKPSEDPSVRCRIAGNVRFTRQTDCLTQGGTVL